MDSEHPPLRRSPRQERGRQRVARLLDAAEELFGETGFEAVTTNQIAAHAGVSIGSLYQFFPNKEAIVSAVAARYQEQASATLEDALDDTAAGLPADELAGRILDAMVGFGSTRVGFTRMVLQAGASPHFAAVATSLMDSAAMQLDAILALRLPALPAAERRNAARVAMTAVMALLGMATAEKPRGHEYVVAIIDEARRMLAAYLASLDARALDIR